MRRSLLLLPGLVLALLFAGHALAPSAPPEDKGPSPRQISRDKVEAAYRRGDGFEKRRLLAEEWATYCGEPATWPAAPVEDASKVVSLRRRRAAA